MIEYWESVDDGYLTWNFKNTIYGDFELSPEAVVVGRVDLFGIAFVGSAGITTAPIEVEYPDGQKQTFQNYTDDPEIIKAIRSFTSRGPGDPLRDSRPKKGGPGSGNWGHRGRPGQEGGSIGGGGGSGHRYRRGREIDLTLIEVDGKKLFDSYERLWDGGPGMQASGYANKEMRALLKSAPEVKSELWQSPELGAIIKAQGFDGLPRVVSKQEMDEIITSGVSVEIFRGVDDGGGKTSLENVEQFRSGDCFVGRGIYGNGIYFTTVRGTAEKYAGLGEGVIRATLHPDARILAYEVGLASASKEVLPIPKTSREAFIQDMISRDIGHWAASKGYDAILLDPGMKSKDKFYVVLNRTAVIVEEAQE